MSGRNRLMVTALALALALAACGLSREARPAPGEAGEAQPGEEQGQPAPPGKEGAAAGEGEAYDGLGLDALTTYAATFEADFTPDDAAVPPWTYRLDFLVGDGPEAMQRSLSISGVSGGKNPGDVTLTRLGDMQYMTGEAVGAEGCLISPASVDLEESFLTPDDFLPPADLSGHLTPDGEETVAGEAGTRYRFEAGALGDLSDAAGEVVLAVDGGYVLRYDFAGRAVDTRFTGGQAGALTWHFAVTDLSPDAALDVPEECAIPYPVMADAYDLAKLPGLIVYSSAGSRADVVAFYEDALPGDGWEPYRMPEESEDKTVLVYARSDTGEVLNVSIIDDPDGGVQVSLFLE
jgi:hypothetical protein